MDIWKWKQSKQKTRKNRSKTVYVAQAQGFNWVTHLPTPRTDNSESPTIRETKTENPPLNCSLHRGCTKSSLAETGMMEQLSQPQWHLGGTFRQVRVTAPQDRRVDSLQLIRHWSDWEWCLLTRWSFVGRACKDLSQTQPSPVQMLRD